MNFEQLLIGQNLDALKQLVLLLPIDWRRGVKANKSEHIKLLIDTLLDPTKLSELVNQLTELEHFQLSHIVHDGWPGLDPVRFMAWHKELPLNIDLKNAYSTPKPQLLWLFLHPPPSTPRYYYGHRQSPEWVMPDELKQRLKPLLKRVPKHALEPMEQAPPDELSLNIQSYHRSWVESFMLKRRSLEETATQEMLSVLQLAQQGKLRVTAKKQQLNKSSLELVAQALVSPGLVEEEDLWRAEFEIDDDVDLDGPIMASRRERPMIWMRLLLAAKALEIHGTKCVITPKGMAMMASTASETLQRIWQAWITSDELDELERVQDLKGLEKFKGTLSPPSQRREHMIEALAALKPQTWYRLEALFDHMFALDMLPWCTDEAQGLWINYDYKDELYGRERVRLVGSWMRLFICEIAATLGLLELCYTIPGPPLSKLWSTSPALTTYDGLYALRLTARGEAFLHGEGELDPLEVSLQAELHVQPDQSIVATGPLPGELVILLDAFTKSTGTLTWKLERKLLLKAHERGDSIEGFERRLLKAVAQEKLPKTVKVLFDDAKRRATMIHAPEPAQLFRFEDKAVALELAHDKKLKELVQMLDDHTLVIAPKDVKTLKSVARKAGYAFAH